MVDFHFPRVSASICTQTLENLSSKSSAGGIVAKQLVAPQSALRAAFEISDISIEF